MRARLRSAGPLIALLVLCAAASIFFPTFLTTTNLRNVFGQVGILGIVAIGMTFVILSGGIDLSVGSTAALAAVVAAQLSTKSALLPVTCPTLVGVLVGVVNGVLITRMGIPPFIATLAVMLGARGLVFLISGGEPVPVDASAWFSQVARGDFLGVPYLGIIFILFLVVAIVVANRTSFGRSVYAIGGNEEAATMMGLGVHRTKMLVYVICGGCAGTAGMPLASRLNSGQLNVAEGWELTAIGAVVVGGTSLTGGEGKMLNTLYGVLILGIIPNIINLEGTLDYWYSDLISGMLLLAVILLQSRVSGVRAAA